MNIDIKEVKKEVKRLHKKFGLLAMFVCDEILDKAYSGDDYDAEVEVPFYKAVKNELETDQ